MKIENYGIGKLCLCTSSKLDYEGNHQIVKSVERGDVVLAKVENSDLYINVKKATKYLDIARHSVETKAPDHITTYKLNEARSINFYISSFEPIDFENANDETIKLVYDFEKLLDDGERLGLEFECDADYEKITRV